MSASEVSSATVGTFLASYLAHVGLDAFFTVPGDYQLTLLDEMMKEKRIKCICCCNELNAGYAADGYGRTKGLAALVVTFGVGTLSCVNAVAGAFAENVPILVIGGSPNNHSASDGEIVHHSLGDPNLDFCQRVMVPITAGVFVLTRPEDTPATVHSAISKCITARKPVYLEIACNIVQQKLESKSLMLPSPQSIQQSAPCSQNSDPQSLLAAVDASLKILKNAKRPVTVIDSPKRRMMTPLDMAESDPSSELLQVLDSFISRSGYAVVATFTAKGTISERHPQYAGIYWSAVSMPTQATQKIVEDADALISIGRQLNDYSAVGNKSKLFRPQDNPSLIVADFHQVSIGSTVYHNVYLGDFLSDLSERIQSNSNSLSSFHKSAGSSESFWKIQNFASPSKSKASDSAEGKLMTIQFIQTVQQMVIDQDPAPKHFVVETGDLWFGCAKLRMRICDEFSVQSLYGSIGWSVGAALGQCIALSSGQYHDIVLATRGEGQPAHSPSNEKLLVPKPAIQYSSSSSSSPLRNQSAEGQLPPSKPRVVLMVGDGSFQMSCQEVSTMIRYQMDPIIFLFNNYGYTVEDAIHSGPYNKIKNWDYPALLRAMAAPDFDGTAESPHKRAAFSAKAQTLSQLEYAVSEALRFRDGPSLIEVCVSPDDCNNELKLFGKLVSQHSQRQ